MIEHPLQEDGVQEQGVGERVGESVEENELAFIMASAEDLDDSHTRNFGHFGSNNMLSLGPVQEVSNTIAHIL